MLHCPTGHKSLCAKIHSLKESLGADDWSLLWTLDFTYAQFQVMCKAKAVDTEVVKAIRNILSALNFRRSAFMEDSKNSGASQIDHLVRAEQERLALKKLISEIDWGISRRR
ncbi:hypothetical protein BDZ97DRAFT_345782 [Flammula alnicola]|nr:hypothetical protein BDZ97DRAFT_345782 [Flammula alnicola]